MKKLLLTTALVATTATSAFANEICEHTIDSDGYTAALYAFEQENHIYFNNASWQDLLDANPSRSDTKAIQRYAAGQVGFNWYGPQQFGNMPDEHQYYGNRDTYLRFVPLNLLMNEVQDLYGSDIVLPNAMLSFRADVFKYQRLIEPEGASSDDGWDQFIADHINEWNNSNLSAHQISTAAYRAWNVQAWNLDDTAKGSYDYAVDVLGQDILNNLQIAETGIEYPDLEDFTTSVCVDHSGYNFFSDPNSLYDADYNPAPTWANLYSREDLTSFLQYTRTYITYYHMEQYEIGNRFRALGHELLDLADYTDAQGHIGLATEISKYLGSHSGGLPQTSVEFNPSAYEIGWEAP